MKRNLLLLGAFMSLLVIAGPGQVNAAEPDMEKVIISFEEEINYQLLEELGAEVHNELPSISAVIATLPDSNIVRAAGDTSIEYIEENEIVRAASTTQETTWGYKHIKTPLAKQNAYTGKGIKIAVVDSGINRNHPDLKIAGGVSFIEGVSTYNDAKGHGTHVAGVIGAQDNSIGTIGVAPDAKLYSVKVLSGQGIGTLAGVVSGIEWAIQNEMDIINLSLTTDTAASSLKEILQKAHDEGIMIVAAAGNAETVQKTNDVLYPARFSSVIAVGSVNQNNQKSDFSYQGPSLELTAPGENIKSAFVNTYTETQEDYSISKGTSVATPFVSGTIALYMEAYPHLSANQIRETIRRQSLDLGSKGRDAKFGYGLVQSLTAKAALFPDLKNNYWYSNSIQNIFDRGIVNGFPDGTYRPGSQISRAEAVTMVGRALNLETQSAGGHFKDVSKSLYAYGYINKASELGFVQGLPDGKFYPEAPIKRGDMALIIQRVFNYTHTQENIFHDIKSTDYYADAIQAAYENGIVEGYGDGLFMPESSITRAEFAQMLAKALESN